jgi:hypothetical protein
MTTNSTTKLRNFLCPWELFYYFLFFFQYSWKFSTEKSHRLIRVSRVVEKIAQPWKYIKRTLMSEILCCDKKRKIWNWKFSFCSLLFCLTSKFSAMMMKTFISQATTTNSSLTCKKIATLIFTSTWITSNVDFVTQILI